VVGGNVIDAVGGDLAKFRDLEGVWSPFDRRSRA
jgi:hypothetical protein